MGNVELLVASLEFIEGHLCDDFKTEDVASACFCSRSALEKLFRCVNGISVHDYVVRRRMMLAARQLVFHPERSILDIALEYGYSTHESFARAFEQVWNSKPSEFRSSRYSELFPRLRIISEDGGTGMLGQKHVDISGLYDLFQERKDNFFVCCDVKGLIKFNEISRKVGDLALLESMGRMVNAAGEQDMVFRIGNDSFCVLTAEGGQEYAEQLAARVRDMNGQTFEYEGRQLSLTLYVCVVRLGSKDLKQEELLANLEKEINRSKHD